MEFKTHEDADRLTLSFSGMLTFDDHETFRSVVTSIVDSPAPTTVLDLSGLTMIDSAGIGMLLLANDRASKQGKQLRLRGVTGHVAKVVELSRLEQLIPID
ncbi:MAG: STAS domain-containing protein [Alphaproteobacteria bacterium]|uniref:STAS domain-containing protein n=1 Tax=Maricaulis alexandrii TaxID=2570354 RepID=UPI001108CC02|nr:STAS domain-containing protein [Maricaulis alexandrii]MCR9266433.1 STAS domain-containing protein [Alphaproteobacteria bacterium]